MNRPITMAVSIAVALVTGFVAGRYLTEHPAVSPPAEPGEREILYWVAPMDPNYRRDEPGKSPMGMELVPVYADEAGAETGVVAIDATMAANLGVRTAVAEQGALPRLVETVGYVGYDEDSLTHVHTRVDGWIEKLAVKAAGDPVSKGQLLFELYSPALVNAQQEYLAALGSGNRGLIDASRDRLASLGMAGDEIARLDRERNVRRRVRFHAEDDGVITMLGVREGIYVTPSTDVVSLAKLDSVWLLAEVFERQAEWVSPGQHAMIEFDYLPGRTWHADVDYVYPELDARTRTLTVRLRLENPSRTLRPNMFARVTIRGSGTGPVVHIPREALIRGGSVDRVVVALDDGRFRSTPVAAGIESGDRVAILDGIAAGERVVVSGQFLIDSESNIESALSRLDNADDGTRHEGHDMGGDGRGMSHDKHGTDREGGSSQ